MFRKNSSLLAQLLGISAISNENFRKISGNIKFPENVQPWYVIIQQWSEMWTLNSKHILGHFIFRWDQSLWLQFKVLDFGLSQKIKSLIVSL